ncbi:MAG TPA: hypothetical protein VGH96_11980 [Streptosporangiaceae bacterium]
MEVPPVPARSSSADSNAAGQVSDQEPPGLSTPDSDAATRICDGDLPVRIAPDRSLIRRQQRMDDPEVLEQVLTSLLNLP